jgi:hypothetical protein
MVDEKTRILNRLSGRLKLYFPQALEWFGSADSQLLWHFLERWPDLESVRKVRRSTLEAFLGAARQATACAVGRCTVVRRSDGDSGHAR